MAKSKRSRAHRRPVATPQAMMAMPMPFQQPMPQMFMLPQQGFLGLPPQTAQPVSEAACSSSSSSSSSVPRAKKGRSTKKGEIPSTIQILSGIGRVKKSEALESLDSRLDATRLADLEDAYLDKLLWILTVVRPTTKLLDLRVATWDILYSKLRRANQRVVERLSPVNYDAMVKRLLPMQPEVIDAVAREEGWSDSYASKKRKASSVPPADLADMSEQASLSTSGMDMWVRYAAGFQRATQEQPPRALPAPDDLERRVQAMRAALPAPDERESRLVAMRDQMARLRDEVAETLRMPEPPSPAVLRQLQGHLLALARTQGLGPSPFQSQPQALQPEEGRPSAPQQEAQATPSAPQQQQAPATPSAPRPLQAPATPSAPQRAPATPSAPQPAPATPAPQRAPATPSAPQAAPATPPAPQRAPATPSAPQPAPATPPAPEPSAPLQQPAPPTPPAPAPAGTSPAPAEASEDDE